MPSSDYFGCTEIFLLSRGSVGQGRVGGGGLFLSPMLGLR